MEKLIVTEIIGGLGNQLFQYAAGRALAHHLNAKLLISISGFEHYNLREYALAPYNTIQCKADDFLLKKFGVHKKFDSQRKGFLKRVHYKYIISKPRRNYAVFSEKNYYSYDSNLFQQSKDHVYINGYWQSYRYFEDIKSILKKELTLKSEPSLENKKIIDLLKTKKYAAIHVRRGDYISNPQANEYHGICNLEYYKKAINIVESQISLDGYLIFSDDILWCKNNFESKLPIVYVNHNGPSLPHEDLRLMQECKAHVIANSSFSWWGAWLAADKTELVIAPEKWTSEHATRTITDLIPQNWVTA